MATKKLQIILIFISWHNAAFYENIHVISEAALQNFPYEKLIRTLPRTKVPQEIYRRAWMLKCDFNKITFQHGFFPVNLLNFSEHLFIRTLLLEGCSQIKYFTIQTLFYKFSNITLSVINLEAFFANKLWTFVTDIWCFLIFIFFWFIFLLTIFHISTSFGVLTYWKLFPSQSN